MAEPKRKQGRPLPGGSDVPTLNETGAYGRGERAMPALPEGDWIGDRYRVVELIGRGGYGEVYRVADAREHEREVALKLHRLRALSRHAIETLKAEFTLLATLFHPNLAPVYDFAYVEGEYAYFTQQMVDGEPLHRATLDPTTAEGVRLLVQLCRALDYLHARGVVHGDVKPGNIVVDPSGERLTLLDFGIARAFGGSAEEGVPGSPAYMAPELIVSGVADARTDLYALGVTLHLLIDGALPFHGAPSRVFHAHVHEDPPPLPEDAPAPLVDLVGRLLSKDPRGRPGSASEVLAELARFAGIDVAVDTDETLASHVLSAPFVGRDDELDALVARAFEANASPPPTVVVGEAGTGKSRLLRETRRRVQLKGKTWLQVQAPRSGGGPGLLAELARVVIGPKQAAALSEEDRIELARALPELRRPRERLAVPLDPERARAHRFRVLARQIEQRFSWKAGVLAIEDVHWASAEDQEELAMLLQAARDAEAHCAVLLGSRAEGLAKDVWTEAGAELLELGPLSPEACRALVESTLGNGSLLDGTELGQALAGSPSSALWVQESLRLALEEGRLRRRAGRFERVGEVPERDLPEVLDARLGHLDRDAISAALAGAVLAQESTVADLARTAGMKPSRASSALHALVKSGVAERREDGRGRARYALHDRYADALLTRMPARRVRAARRRVGKWLSRRYPKDPRMLGRAAHELVAAGEGERAARVLERGARLAEELGRPDRAVELLAREVSLREGSDPRRDRALLSMHDLATRCGRADEASRALKELRARSTETEDPVLAVELRVREARGAVRDGDFDTARDQAAAALAELDAVAERDTRALRSEVEVLGGRIAKGNGRSAEGLEHFERAAKLARSLGRHDLLARAELELALVLVRRGDDDRAAATAKRAVAAARASKDPVLRSEAERMMGNAHFIAGRRSKALRAYRRAVKVARESGGSESEAKALNNVATCAHALGQVREAITAWRRSIDLKERVGAVGPAMLTRASMSGVLTVIGERDAAREAQEAAIHGGRGHDEAVGLGWANRGDLEMVEGNLEAAIEAYERGADAYRRLEMFQLRAHALTGAIRTYLVRGWQVDMVAAERAYTELEELEYGTSAPEDRRRLLTARALVRELRGDAEGALEDARSAARIERADTSYDSIFGTLVDARWMVSILEARVGRPKAAERSTERARKTLTRRAQALEDPVDRERFLELPLHRAVRAGERDQPPGRTW